MTQGSGDGSAQLMPRPPHRVFGWIDRQLTTDARSLAVGRIGIALLLLYDLGLRASDLRAHYTDAGVLPRSLFQLRDWSFVWSFHEIAGGGGFQAFLFALAALAGICLLVGYRTRAATLASFLLALSVQGRNPFLHDGQDDLLRVLLFWGLWLPLGQRFSVDARCARLRAGAASTGTPDRVSGLLGFGLVGQLTLLYESSAIGKLQSAWWTHGNGVLHALELGRYQTVLGQWLTQFSGLLRLVNAPVIGLELALPLLLWIPWQRERLRLLGVLLATALHTSFGLFLNLSIFPELCICAWWLLAPALAWSWRPARLATPAAGAPPPPTTASGFWLALPLLALAGLYVAGTHLDQPVLPPLARRAVEALGLQQYWVVFSPRNTQRVSDGYFVAPALLPDGREIDLFDGEGPVRWQPPRLGSRSFADTRWRHFYANLIVEWARGSDQQRTTLAAREATVAWLCRDYQHRHPELPHPFRISLYFVEHSVDRPGDGEHRRLLDQNPCLP